MLWRLDTKLPNSRVILDLVELIFVNLIVVVLFGGERNSTFKKF